MPEGVEQRKWVEKEKKKWKVDKAATQDGREELKLQVRGRGSAAWIKKLASDTKGERNVEQRKKQKPR